VEFNDDGGTFVLEIAGHGRWQVNVPWIVAIEGWYDHTGAQSFERDDLSKWLTDHAWRFSAIVTARVDEVRLNGARDDPRVEAFCVARAPAAERVSPVTVVSSARNMASVIAGITRFYTFLREKAFPLD
jgi:hypothetical protein